MSLSFAAAADVSTNPDLAAGISSLDLAPVWAGHPVGFALLTEGDRQFVAYYDAQRQLCVAQRTLGQRTWQITKLDSFVKWDSHNYLTMAADRQGYLHLSGNMHVAPLIYFRSTRPLDAASLTRVPAMIGTQETHCTYPRFLKSPAGALIFNYRDGRSGQGDTYYNIYDETTRTWSRLFDQPLFSGLGKMNAYPLDPKLGPDGLYHMSWVWRSAYLANMNHDLSYAQSKDLRHWETITGQPIQLPITIHTPGVIVDPVPVNGGIINGTGMVGFDRQNRVVISYHKFDSAGNTQLYFAHFENGEWKHEQATDWKYRWDIEGGGSLVPEIHLGAVTVDGDKLVISLSHKKYGSGTWEVDEKTWRLKGKVPTPGLHLTSKESKVASTFPGMQVEWASDLAPPRTDGVTYRLRWETLGPNRDQPRPPPWPAPSMLRLLVVR
jgi:hypothetical protein